MPLTPIAPGQIAAIVTSLEMLERPRPRSMPESCLRLRRWIEPSLKTYRGLFRRVGEPWLWFSRLVMADSDLALIISDPESHIFAVEDRRGVEVGILELDFRNPGQCELAYF